MFGGVLILGVLVLIGVAVWRWSRSRIAGTRGPSGVEAGSTAEAGGRARTRQILDERYARGELTTEQYSERLRTLGL